MYEQRNNVLIRVNYETFSGMRADGKIIKSFTTKGYYKIQYGKIIYVKI